MWSIIYCSLSGEKERKEVEKKLQVCLILTGLQNM